MIFFSFKLTLLFSFFFFKKPAPTLAAGSSSSSVSSSNSSVPEASSADELARLIEYNDAVGVRRHLKKHAADVNAALDSRGRTPLMFAARTVRGDTNLMRVLLRCDRIVVNARDSGGNTALHHLVRSLTSGAIVAEVSELMAQHRADFAAVNAMHETILHVAVGNLAVPSLVVAVLERDCVDIGARTSHRPRSLLSTMLLLRTTCMPSISCIAAGAGCRERRARQCRHARVGATASPLGGSDRIVPLLRVERSCAGAPCRRCRSTRNLAQLLSHAAIAREVDRRARRRCRSCPIATRC
jgi:hypothetical protein